MQYGTSAPIFKAIIKVVIILKKLMKEPRECHMRLITISSIANKNLRNKIIDSQSPHGPT